jgi:uncharacterized protein (TIGR03435 family)
MLSLWVECTVRAALLIAAVALVLWAMRIKTASVRHAVWCGVVVTMLALPALVAWGPHVPLPLLGAQPGQARTVSVATIDRPAISAQVPEMSSREVANASRPFVWSWLMSAVVVYLLGMSIFLLRLTIGTIHVQRLRHSAIVKDGQWSHSSLATPITVGWWKPTVLLPSDWQQWPTGQLAAVLAHEAEHVRRRDPLFQWLALLNRAIFWFHPLAWWLDRELSGLAEEACDAAVLAKGHDPREYSQYLLQMARKVRSEGTRIHMLGLAMPGAALPNRIQTILSGIRPSRTSLIRLASTVTLCAAAVTAFGLATLVRAQTSNSGPSFEVASIRPADPHSGVVSGSNRRGGHFTFEGSVASFIEMAYDVQPFQINGGPAWIKTERFVIQASAPEATTRQQSLLMLRALLDSRFKLHLLREAKDSGGYRLVETDKGLKIALSDKASGMSAGKGNLRGSMDFSEFAKYLQKEVGRPVVNATGINGAFDVNLTWTPDSPAGASTDATTGPSIFTAIQEQTGLKLESARVPIEMLAVQRVERPSAN